MKLIVGLGNPGSKFSHSRHNVGFECVEHMARKWRISLSERRSKVVLGQGEISGASVILAKPRTFMNNSGDGIKYLLTRFSASAQQLVVVYDDMDLPLGGIRIRPEGSAAGHKGMGSIMTTLSTQQFPRVRVGIGKVPEGEDGMDYVLGQFSREERKVIQMAVAQVTDAVACLLQDGIDAAMNRFN